MISFVALWNSPLIHYVYCVLVALRNLLYEYLDMTKIVVTSPLKFVYLSGPSLAGFGFWNGVPYSQICAQLTRVETDHWKENAVACQSLVDRQVDAFVVSLLLGVVLAIVIKWILKTLLEGLFKLWYTLKTIHHQKDK